MYPSFPNSSQSEAVSAELFIQLYRELKTLARRQCAMEQPGRTLNTTALVHEAWIRLEGATGVAWESKAHFFGAAAEAMRRILVEAARRRLAAKRGSGEAAVPMDGMEIAAIPGDSKMLAVHEALERLEMTDELKARIVKLRFFSGLENGEIAALLEVNEKTVRRHWELAKVWLYRAIKETE